MAKTFGTMAIPIIARFMGRDYEIGVLEIEVEATPSGKVKPPSAREIKQALKKGLR